MFLTGLKIFSIRSSHKDGGIKNNVPGCYKIAGIFNLLLCLLQSMAPVSEFKSEIGANCIKFYVMNFNNQLSVAFLVAIN